MKTTSLKYSWGIFFKWVELVAIQPFVMFAYLFFLSVLHAIVQYKCTSVVMDRVPEISQKNGLRQIEQGFSSFFCQFFPYLIIFQIWCAPL